MHFTQTRINALKCPPGQRDKLYYDEVQRGLAVRVLESGSKSYLATYTEHGKKRRIPLGSCDAISLAQARAAVQTIMGDRARGIDPELRYKQSAAPVMTLAGLIEDWRALHLNGRRPRYSAEAVRVLRRTFARYLNEPAEGLGRPAIIGVIDALSRAGSNAMAASTAAYGRSCYGWALRRGAVKVNPFENLPVAPAVRRERVLTDEELAAIWRATDGLGPFDGIVRLSILTGQRRDEVRSLPWAELSADLSIWTIPGDRTKNGRAHIVPLSEPARALLRAIPRTGALVFQGRHGAFNGFAKSKRALDVKSGVKNWRLHDLRRTAATGLQRLGTRLEVTEAVLNHIGGSRGGIVSVYQRHTYEAEKQAASGAWAAHVMAVTSGRELPANVSRIGAGGRQ